MTRVSWLAIVGNTGGFNACAQSGIPLWTNRFSGPGSFPDSPAGIASDTNGNVFISGTVWSSSSNLDFVTIKYSPGGTAIWTNIFDGPPHKTDLATGIAVSQDGNVYVTGSCVDRINSSGSWYADIVTIAYSNAGMPLWTNFLYSLTAYSSSPTALAADNEGNVCVTGRNPGPSGDDYYTVKYSRMGVALWTNRYDGPSSHADQPVAIAIDGSGSVFVTGNSDGTGAGYDYATIAYSPDGVPLWTNRYDGGTNSSDLPTSIAVDRNGKVFVTGRSQSTSGKFEFATVAYSSNSLPLWTNRYAGSSHFWDQANGIAVDNSGRVFVTGYGQNPNSAYDYITIAYLESGIGLWTNRYTTSGSTDDEAKAVAVDSKGNVFVTGFAYNGGYDYLTIAYSNDGAPLWTNKYNGMTTTEKASSVCVDRQGDVLVTGTSDSSGGGDIVTIKYGPTRLTPIPLVIESAHGRAVLAWTNSAFALQVSPNLSGGFTNIPGATSPYTNPVSRTEEYFRLISN